MLRVVGPDERPPRSGPGQRRQLLASIGSTSPTRTRRSRTRPASPRRPRTTPPSIYVGDQGRAQGAAHFSRLEGAAFAKGRIYFTSTQGGGPAETGPQLTLGYGRGAGQVWSYDPRRQTADLRLPVTGHGDARAARQHHRPQRPRHDRALRGRPGRQLHPRPHARRRAVRHRPQPPASQQPAGGTANAPRFAEEFAGATFSPDGETLFVNIQASRALTFAIWGPWGRLGV